MGSISWYRRYPDQALQGMFELTLEERGAYNTILDLIYVRDGKLPDDDRFIAGWMRVDVRVWKRIKARLNELGKLRVEGGFIRNSKADEEVSRAISRVASAREAGLASASSKQANRNIQSNKDSGLSPTVVEFPQERASQLDRDRDRDRDREKKEREDKSSPKKASRWKEGDPFPEEWLAWAMKERGWSLGPAQREAERFLDYAMANGKTYTSWQAAWRQWCRSPFQKTEGSKQQALTL